MNDYNWVQLPDSNNPFHHFAGLLIYFLYGMHFSVQRKRHTTVCENTDTASDEKQPYIISEEKFWVHLSWGGGIGIEIEMLQWVTASSVPAVLGAGTPVDTFWNSVSCFAHFYISVEK